MRPWRVRKPRRGGSTQIEAERVPSAQSSPAASAQRFETRIFAGTAESLSAVPLIGNNAAPAAASLGAAPGGASLIEAGPSEATATATASAGSSRPRPPWVDATALVIHCAACVPAGRLVHAVGYGHQVAGNAFDMFHPKMDLCCAEGKRKRAEAGVAMGAVIPPGGPCAAAPSMRNPA